MAVDFSLLPPEEAVSERPPSRLAWTVAFFLMVLVGVFAVLFFWPKDMPTHTWNFWASLVLFPVGIPVWIVLRRYSVYESRKLDTALHNEAVQAFNESVFRAASIPLSVIAAAHRFSADREQNATEAVRQGSVALRTQAPIARDGEPVKARWLVVPGMKVTSGTMEDDRNRRRHVMTWLFGELLDQLSSRIQALPVRVPLRVRICTSNGLTHEENEALWQACWHARSLRKAELVPATESPADLMMIDSWLDEILGGEKLHVMLIVAAQLHPLLAGTPPPGTAEAGTALLLAPETLAFKHGMQRIAHLHRPVQALLDLPGDALCHAMQWAGVPAQQIAGGWQTGLDATQTGVLREPSKQLGLTARPTDLDQTVGYAGAAAPWLAAACAASSLSGSSDAQIVLAGQETHLHCAILKRTNHEDMAR